MLARFSMLARLHCEHCNCYFPPHSLDQHQSGRRHLRNVASNRLPNVDTPQQPPSSQPGDPNAQLAPLPNTLPPRGGNAPTPAADSRDTVSDEGGLDNLVVANQLASNPSLSSDEEGELLDITDTGISVSDEDGLDFGIIERTHSNGPFATQTSSLTIKNAEGFPSITLAQAIIRPLHGSGSGWVMTHPHCCLHLSAASAS
jgi:hypothetical protein